MREQPVVLIVQTRPNLTTPNIQRRISMPEHRATIRVVRHVFCSRLTNCVWGVDRVVDARQRVSANEGTENPAIEEEVFVGWRISTGMSVGVECPGTQIVSVADREADITTSLWTLNSSLVSRRVHHSCQGRS